jgi:hypothetical protein
MAVTVIDLAHAATGDLLIWELPEGAAGPVGATLLPGARTDEEGFRTCMWWQRYTGGLAVESMWPRPRYCIRQ